MDDIMEILIADECGVFDDLDKDKEEREEEKDETVQKTN